MKKLVCPKCHKTMNYGKFCLDCGTPLNEVITPDTKFKKIKTARSTTTLKSNVRNWLSRIGVQQPDIQINSDHLEASINYILKGRSYSFKSNMQESEADNLAAVELFLHNRVIGVERGIETAEQAFAGYVALPDHTNDKNFNPYETLGFTREVSFEEANKKYKTLAKLHHPDVNDSPEAERTFRSINKAIKMIKREK